MRKAIIDAALTKFHEKSISATTMDEVAEQAMISRATLFNYFPSKAEIIGQIVELMDENFIKQIDGFVDGPQPLAKRVEEFFCAHAHDLETRWLRFCPLMGISVQGWDETVGARRFARFIAAFLRLVHDAPEADRLMLAEVLAGTYIGIVHRWRFEAGYPLQKRLVAAARLVLSSIK